MGMQNQRLVYGQTLVELGGEDERIVVLEADLGKSTQTHLFKAAFPERYFEMGIAEANMTSFAAGLALTGKVAFVNSFAVFATGRAYDQIRQGVCIGKLNVKVVGSSAGLSDFGDGATHQGIEDVALMRAIPNMTVLAPVDGIETKKMVRAIAAYDGPVYMRLNRNDLPDVYPQDLPFQIGTPVLMRDGNEAVAFAHGVMVSKALEAAETLEREGISLRVVNVSTLKPVAESALLDFASGVKGVVTAEEHSIIGGLASVVAYALRGRGIPIECVAVNDTFGESALDYEQILAHYGLTAERIVAAVRRAIGEK